MTNRITLPSDQDATGRTFGPEELEAVRQCLASGTLTSTKGNFVKQLETKFAAKIGARFAYACSSGTAAVHCAIAALDTEPGDEIITTSITDMGAITPNEIRDREDFELLDTEAANQTFVQLGFSTLDAAAAPAGAAGGEPPADATTGGEAEDSPEDSSEYSGGESVAEAGGFRVGQRVYFDGGDGVIEHLMVDGVLGVEGSPFAIAATEVEPAASVRVYMNDEPTEFTVGKRVSELSATPIESQGGDT
jgi:hypothetical protein